jgi:hypothetical protein
LSNAGFFEQASKHFFFVEVILVHVFVALVFGGFTGVLFELLVDLIEDALGALLYRRSLFLFKLLRHKVGFFEKLDILTLVVEELVVH